ncbi:uncharacterized protein LOC141678071 [Apium graveolens]|uniref:uncharacterized protein LOC141678071 n=1 Tax=Apium graveolens TaxID=4045 RepID=UPI003D7959A8
MFQAKELTITHVAHPQHSLALIHRPCSFKCDACNVEENIRDMSYKCTTCQFWIHKSCADAPNLLYLFQSLHEHPIFLFYGRPQRYHAYNLWCRLCSENISQLSWYYQCRDECTFLTHLHCARSRSSEYETYDSNLVHLPAADESSRNLLVEQFLKLMVDNNFSAEDKHWSHEHPLQLITSNDLNDQKGDDGTDQLLCDGCIKPIRTDGDQFFGCVLCKFFLHKVCAEISRSLVKDLFPGKIYRSYMSTEQCTIIKCDWCGGYGNGMYLEYYSDGRYRKIHIECWNLPKTIKHEAHRHQLDQVFTIGHACNACGIYYKEYCSKHRCEQCEFYICVGCSMKPRTVTHPWDPHPLYLRYDAGMVMNHDYEFNCEFCSEEINTNFWFYHCSDCDLSFHLGYCFEMSSYRYYSNVKTGRTFFIDSPLHYHRLGFVLNKKVRSCLNCDGKQLGKPVLECLPCKILYCTDCVWMLMLRQNRFLRISQRMSS